MISPSRSFNLPFSGPSKMEMMLDPTAPPVPVGEQRKTALKVEGSCGSFLTRFVEWFSKLFTLSCFSRRSVVQIEDPSFVGAASSRVISFPGPSAVTEQGHQPVRPPTPSAALGSMVAPPPSVLTTVEQRIEVIPVVSPPNGNEVLMEQSLQIALDFDLDFQLDDPFSEPSFRSGGILEEPASNEVERTVEEMLDEIHPDLRKIGARNLQIRDLVANSTLVSFLTSQKNLKQILGCYYLTQKEEQEFLDELEHSGLEDLSKLVLGNQDEKELVEMEYLKQNCEFLTLLPGVYNQPPSAVKQFMAENSIPFSDDDPNSCKLSKALSLFSCQQTLAEALFENSPFLTQEIEEDKQAQVLLGSDPDAAHGYLLKNPEMAERIWEALSASEESDYTGST